MVYKKYITRNGKRFGPYYYESYRDKGGKVRTRFISGPRRGDVVKRKVGENSRVIVFFGSLFFVVLLFLMVVVYSYDDFGDGSGFGGGRGGLLTGDVVGDFTSGDINDYLIKVFNVSLDSGRYDYGYGLGVDFGGNLYVVGLITEGINVNWNVIKYNFNGEKAWRKTYDSGRNDVAKAVFIDSLGYVYVAGYYNNGDDNDLLIIKYDSNGKELWKRTYDGGGDDESYGISVDIQGNVYVVGTLDDNGKNIVVIKYTGEGEKIWSRVYDSGKDDYATSIFIHFSREIYISGYVGNVDNDFLVLKYDINGEEIWSRVYDSGKDDYATDLASDYSGDIYVVGYYNLSNSNNMRIIKYSPAGEEIWNRKYENNVRAHSIGVDKNKYIYIGGAYQGGGDTEGISLKFNSEGRELWSYKPEIPNSVVNDIFVDRRNNFFILVNSDEFDYYAEKVNDSSDVFSSNEISCLSDWRCEEWSECIDRIQVRSCSDSNECGVDYRKPEVKRECLEELELYVEETGGSDSGVRRDLRNIKWTCGEWGECNAAYDLKNIVSGEEDYLLRGEMVRLCRDTNGKSYDRVDIKKCTVGFSVKTKRVQECFKDYLAVYDLNDNLISNLEFLDEERVLNIDFSFIENVCYFCYDGVKNFDEVGVDCGGSCPACV